MHQIRVLLTQHMTWLVNSAVHVWGDRPYRTGDGSRNNAAVALLVFGDGWHNNHHVSVRVVFVCLCVCVFEAGGGGGGGAGGCWAVLLCPCFRLSLSTTRALLLTKPAARLSHPNPPPPKKQQAFPASAAHGLEWWQLDPSYYVICGLERLGLAWDVRRPSEAQKARLRWRQPSEAR